MAQYLDNLGGIRLECITIPGMLYRDETSRVSIRYVCSSACIQYMLCPLHGSHSYNLMPTSGPRSKRTLPAGVPFIFCRVLNSATPVLIDLRRFVHARL